MFDENVHRAKAWRTASWFVTFLIAACAGDSKSGSDSFETTPLASAAPADLVRLCEDVQAQAAPSARASSCTVFGILAEQQGRGACEDVRRACLETPATRTESDEDPCQSAGDSAPLDCQDVTLGEYRDCIIALNAALAANDACAQARAGTKPPSDSACARVQKLCPEALQSKPDDEEQTTMRGEATAPPAAPADAQLAVGTAVDLDHDGSPDGVAVDDDGDRVVDAVDTNGDGKGDVKR